MKRRMKAGKNRSSGFSMHVMTDDEVHEIHLGTLEVLRDVGGPVNDTTLAVDVIKEMGIGQDYLSHPTTYKHMRSQSQARLMDRRMREDWEAAGSTDAYKRSHDKMLDILESYEPPQLTDDVLKTVRSIVKEAEGELGVDGGGTIRPYCIR